jgi:excisionase family DNA binding protein
MNVERELEQYFTIKQLSQSIHESEWGIRRKAKAGIIKSTKPGKYYLFRKEDVEEYLSKDKGGEHGK